MLEHDYGLTFDDRFRMFATKAEHSLPSTWYRDENGHVYFYDGTQLVYIRDNGKVRWTKTRLANGGKKRYLEINCWFEYGKVWLGWGDGHAIAMRVHWMTPSSYQRVLEYVRTHPMVTVAGPVDGEGGQWYGRDLMAKAGVFDSIFC